MAKPFAALALSLWHETPGYLFGVYAAVATLCTVGMGFVRPLGDSGGGVRGGGGGGGAGGGAGADCAGGGGGGASRGAGVGVTRHRAARADVEAETAAQTRMQARTRTRRREGVGGPHCLPHSPCGAGPRRRLEVLRMSLRGGVEVMATAKVGWGLLWRGLKWQRERGACAGSSRERWRGVDGVRLARKGLTARLA
eukprot:6077668-Pleurochrysis_carterae.AAC.1